MGCAWFLAEQPFVKLRVTGFHAVPIGGVDGHVSEFPAGAWRFSIGMQMGPGHGKYVFGLRQLADDIQHRRAADGRTQAER